MNCIFNQINSSFHNYLSLYIGDNDNNTSFVGSYCLFVALVVTFAPYYYMCWVQDLVHALQWNILLCGEGPYALRFERRPFIMFLSDEGPTHKTLEFTLRFGSTPTFLYIDLYLNTACAAHCVYSSIHQLSIVEKNKQTNKQTNKQNPIKQLNNTYSI